MGTEYEIKVIFDLIIGNLRQRKLRSENPDVQKEIDEIVKDIQAVRNGQTQD